jgi:hypothetical protein
MGEAFSFSHRRGALNWFGCAWREALDACRKGRVIRRQTAISDNRGLAQIDVAHGMIIDPAEPGAGTDDCLMRRKA